MSQTIIGRSGVWVFSLFQPKRLTKNELCYHQLSTRACLIVTLWSHLRLQMAFSTITQSLELFTAVMQVRISRIFSIFFFFFFSHDHASSRVQPVQRASFKAQGVTAPPVKANRDKENVNSSSKLISTGTQMPSFNLNLPNHCTASL